MPRPACACTAEDGHHFYSGPVRTQPIVERLERHQYLMAMITWGVGAAAFFRDPLTSRLDTITGDRGDARLCVVLHEHWFRVLHGDESWLRAPMYFPTKATLGYSETFVLNEIFYAPLRFIGFEPFAAFQLTLVCLTAVGFAATFAVLRRHLGVAVLPACALGYAATFANNLFVDTGHPQMYAVAFVPVVLLAGLEARRASAQARQVLAGVTGLVLGLLVYSAYYVGWFTVLLGSMWLAIVTVALVRRQGWAVARSVLRTNLRPGFAFAAGLGIAMVPFVITYLPIFRSFGGRPYSEVVGLSPHVRALVDVGSHNVAWGWLMRPLLHDDAGLLPLVHTVAPTPLLMLLVIVSAWVFVQRRRNATATGADRAGLAAACVVTVAWVLPLRFGAHGLWWAVFRFVPGATAIRVPGRLEVVNAWLACVVVGCLLSHGRHVLKTERLRRAMPALALILVMFEQTNTTIAFRRFDRSDEITALAAVPPPPNSCRSFAVVDPTKTVYDGVSIDAMLIAQHIGRPTVNGYSGQSPPGWNLRPWLDDYTSLTQQWAIDRGIATGLCTYNLTTREWSALK